MRVLTRIQLSVLIDMNLFKFEIKKILYNSVGTSCRHDGKAPHFLAELTPGHREELRATYVDGNHMSVVRQT